MVRSAQLFLEVLEDRDQPSGTGLDAGYLMPPPPSSTPDNVALGPQPSQPPAPPAPTPTSPTVAPPVLPVGDPYTPH